MTRVLVLMLACVAVVTISQANTYSVTLVSSDYQLLPAKDGFEKVEMTGFAPMGIPGKPAVPTRTFMVLLPPGADVVSLSASGTPREIDGVHKVRPAPMQVAKGVGDTSIAQARKEYEANLVATYGSDEVYPREAVTFEGMGNLRKWRFAYVRFSPLQCRPKSGKLARYDQVSVAINYTLPADGTPAWEAAHRLLGDTAGDGHAREVFANFADGRKWYSGPSTQKNGGCLLGGPVNGDTYRYCIIVPTVDYGADIQDFINWKIQRLSPDTVIWCSADSIVAYYPARDTQESIRNFLKDLLPYGLLYVLLIDDNVDIPMRYCWPDPSIHYEVPDLYPVPTDFYYADLHGNWDADGDGFFGEFGDDSVDFMADVSVGRIPEFEHGTIQGILAKLIRFEANNETWWKKNALMLGSVSVTSNSGPYTDEARIMEAICDSLLDPLGWTHTRLYEQDGLEPSWIACDDSLREDKDVSCWSYYQFGYVNWSGHGSAKSAYRTINIGGGRDSMPYIFDQYDVPSLNDDYPSVVFSSACLTGKPEVNCLGQQLMEQGAAGFIGGTRSVYGPMGDIEWNSGGNTSFNCYYALCMMRYGARLGDALCGAQQFYRALNYNSPHDQQNLLAFAYYGDPAMTWQGVSGIQDRPGAMLSARPTLTVQPNPASGRAVLNYNLPTGSKARVSIHDAAGRLVKTLSAALDRAGAHRVVWDARTADGHEASTGVYFCTLQTDDKSVERKFLLVR